MSAIISYIKESFEELTNNLLQQIKPFKIKFHLNQRVEQLKKANNRWQQ